MRLIILVLIFWIPSLSYLQPVQINGTKPIQISTIGNPVIIRAKPTILNNLTSEVRDYDASIQMNITVGNNPTSFNWSTLSGTGTFEVPTDEDAWVTGASFGVNVFRVVAANAVGNTTLDITVLIRPTYDSLELFGGSSFYTDDQFFGNIDITPYASDSSLITYTGVGNPFTSEYLNKQFVAFKAHKTDVFPSTRNYTPGISTCVYAKVIRIIDGKNVRVDFAYNGNNQSSPQPSTNAYGQFFFDNREAFDLAISTRARPIGLINGKTYATKGLFGTSYYASQIPIEIISHDTTSSIPANIKFSMEDAFYAGTNNLYTGWEVSSSHWAYDYGTRSEGIRLIQVAGNNNFKVAFINTRFLPPTYSTAYNGGSNFATYFFSSGTAANYTASYQHYGLVDVAGADCLYEKRKWESYSLPGIPVFNHLFGFVYSNSGGRLDSVETITGRRLDVVDYMEYRLRPNPYGNVNSSWLTTNTMANLKGKVKSANSTYHPIVSGGGYGAAGNYWTIRGIGRNPLVSYETDTLLSDIGTNVTPRQYRTPLRATFTEQTIDGIPRLIMSGTSDSAWTVWTNPSYYNWSLWAKGSSTNMVTFTFGGSLVVLPLTSVGVENYRDDFSGVPDSRNNVTVGLRSIALAHDIPSIGTTVTLQVHPLEIPARKLSIRRWAALPTDTLRKVGTTDDYKVISNYFQTYSNDYHIDSHQLITLEPIGSAPALDLSILTTYDFTFQTQKLRDNLSVPFADAISIDYRFNGSELNYGDPEVNHDWAYVRKYGRMRYGTEFGDNIEHNQQLWKMPKVQRWKDVYEYQETDNYGIIAGNSFARREIITGTRSTYLIDGGLLRGYTAGGSSRIRWQNRPTIGGAGFAGGTNTPPTYSHGVEQDGLGAVVNEDVRFVVQRNDTADLTNVTSNFGIQLMAFDSTSIIKVDSLEMTYSGIANFGYERHIYPSTKFAYSPLFTDTALLGGVGRGPLYPAGNVMVGKYIGNGVSMNFSALASLGTYVDYDNTVINITGTLTPNDFRWVENPITNYVRYCYAIKVNGLSPLPGSQPVTYLSPCPPE